MISPIVGSDPTAETLARALGSQYEVVRLLGRGGMGSVYLAREPFLERDVAVKVLPGDMASGDARERFLREARTAARLSHPNIVPLYTFGQAGDVLYYVMGYVDGESLEARIKREGRLPADETRRITSELADALEYAHRSGVVHRDVKPDNVLLDRVSGRAMLTDFGVAKQRAGLETLTQAGVIVGTPHYMSPEQASGDRDLDGRSDIYSLGVMAYRMATGRLPFEGTALREVLVQHATRAPIPPTQIVPSLPLDLDTVITRALAKEPAQRWPNARAMREALSPDSEESLPERLQVISSMGTRITLLSAALAEFGFLGKQFGWAGGPFDLALYGTAILVTGIGLFATIPAARRYGWRTAFREYWRQPKWWTMWYPRLGRATNDVWDRLPRRIWQWRLVNSISVPVGLAAINLMVWGLTKHLASGDPRFMNAMAIGSGAWFIGYVGALGWLTQSARSFAKRAGLSKQDTEKLLSASTGSPGFWSRPHIAALLRPAASAARATTARSPTELVADVEQVGRVDPLSPHASLYKEAAQAAAGIAAAIAHADQELGQLARDADPRERERIEGSLAALGARTQETTAKSQMRELLERQLQILRELDLRRELLAERRAHLHEQLRALALHIAALRASADANVTLEITGRIRAVMREVDYQVEAAEEVRSLLSRS